MQRRHRALRFVLPLTLAGALASVVVASPRFARADVLVPPAPLAQTPAPYPAGATGDAAVELELIVGKDGRVESAKVVTGAPPFDAAAREAALHWTFTPATRDGLPIRARIRAKVAFHPPAVAPPPATAPTTLPVPSATQPPPTPTTPAPVAPPSGQPIVLDVHEEREELGSTHVPRSEVRFIPGAFADPFRVVEALPGVAPIVSGIPYFYVRGAPPGDVGYAIDGLRVPLLFHVGAGPSVIAPALVDRVDLYPSVYPAAFGRSVGGVMSGETTAPSDVPRAEIQARIFDAGAMVEQPFAGGRGSILLGGRYGYTGFLLSKVAPDYSLGYWDYQGRVAYRVTPTDTISLFAFGAYDRLTNELRRANLLDVQFHRLDLRWDHRDEDTRARVALTASADHEANGEDRVDGAASDATRRGLRLRGEIAHRFAAFRLRAGADVGLERFTDDRVTLGGRSFAFDPRSDLVSGAWMDLVARPARGVEIVPGLRVDLFRTRGDLELVVDPRLAVRFRLGRGVSLVSALGVAHQVPTASIPVPGRAVGGLEGAPLQEAYQASEALELALPSYVFVKLTAFAARIHVPGFGTAAENHGLEVFVRRDFTKTLGFLLSYTLARTSRPGSLTGLSEFDRTHVLSAVLGYDLGAGFRLGVRGFFETGRPYVQRCPYPSCAPGPVPPIDAPYPYVATGRMPSFFRFDARFEKRWTFGERWIAATLEWFNATLSTEPDYVAWDPMLGSKVIRRSALTLPSLGIEAGY